MEHRDPRIAAAVGTPRAPARTGLPGAAFVALGLLAGGAPLAAQDTAAAAPADTLSLSSALAEALAKSPAIATAAAARTSGQAGRWESWGALFPTVNVSSGFGQDEILRRTATDPITGGIVTLPDSLIELRRSMGTSATLTLNWTVFDGGRRLWGIRRAAAQADAADQELVAARARVAGEVTEAYLDALEAVALEETRRAELEGALELRKLAEARFEQGAVPELDVLQARLAEGDAEVALMQASASAEAARLALAEYLPDFPGADFALGDVGEPIVDALPPEEELRACALERSPLLRGQQAQVGAARRGVETERLWFLPTVSFTSRWQRSESGQTREAFTFSPRNTWSSYSLGFSWQPLDGRQVAAQRRAQAALATATAQLTSARARIVRETTVALRELQRARATNELRELNLEVARLQREQANERYRLGASSISERFQAEALAQEAERQAIVSRYTTLRALAALSRATGIAALDGIGALCGGS